MSWNPDHQHVSDRLQRFYSLDDLIKWAYGTNDWSKASGLAKEYLELAGQYRCNWNYGNAIHDGNQYLGLISLKNGDEASAVAYLLKSGKSSGSPQLNTFGPGLDLANALLQAGHSEPVKLYLTDIKRFWKMNNGRVDEWLASMEKGERPALGRFPPKPSTMQLALIWLVLAWPALAIAGSLYVQRRRIVAKWRFGLAAIVIGYLALFAAGWATSHALPGLVQVLANWPTLVKIALDLSVALSFVIPLLAILATSRFFWAKEK